MLDTAFLLMMNGLFLMLRINPADSFPKPLSREEEDEAVALWLNGDIEARNKLVEHNLRLVSHIMKKYYTSPENAEDLVSIGTVGLIKGINTYRPEKGVKLATYASRCIENELLMYFRAGKKSRTDVSLSEALEVDGDGGSLSVIDVVAADENMEEQLENAELCRNLRDCVDTALTRREADIVALRYGLDGRRALTQRETAEKCGISRSYVSRIEKKALKKLKTVLENDNT